MSKQAQCIMLLDQLMSLNNETAFTVMQECDMTLGFIRKGPNTVPDDGEMEHLAELMSEAIAYQNTLKD